MATGRVFSGTHPIPSLMGRGLNLINEFGMCMSFFFNRGRVQVLSHPAPPRPVPFIYKINFNFNFKINLI